MTTLTIFCVLVFVNAPASASNNGTESLSQAFANSTHVVDMARRQTACTNWNPSTSSYGTQYACANQGYTQVPSVANGLLNSAWYIFTEWIYLYNNAISFIPVDAFNGLTYLTVLSLYGNAITLIPAGLLDNNPALTFLNLKDNDISSVPVGMVDNNTALTALYLNGNPLVCGYTDSWVVGTAISSFCTSCTNGTPETITVDTVDFWQCFISESPTVSPTVSTTVSTTVSPSADAAASSIKHNVPLIAGMVVLCIIIIGIV